MASLMYVESANVVFRDDTYRWLDAAHFAISGRASEPRAVLEVLLRHDQYLDHYMTAAEVACTPVKDAEIARHRAAFKAEVLGQLPHVAGPVSDDQQSAAARPLHGPYYAEFVTPESFDRLEAKTIRKTVEAWLCEAGGDCDQPVPPVEQMEGDLPALLARLDAFDDVYQLRELPDTALHDFGFVVQPYLEIIGVSRRDLLLVAGGTD